MRDQKKHYGMGVLLGWLAGNKDSVEAMHRAIGQRILAISLGDDDALHLMMANSFRLKIADEGQSCCEERYMRTDDDLSRFVGAILLGAEVRDGPTMEGKYGDQHEVQFLVINTSMGSLTMQTHNEHNGYYGGFCLRASEEKIQADAC